ncbi:peroxiredoxin family protein [Patiriisocius hiemis]|uniref:TlpA disulfide reductase family protein n=1 Tax=Patiriisocius hiemis TaxID=3075604 RepID=A0ABU2Y8T4_9FLAO|nr:TlpA disulfide reductase family protein [Constantimarinum sp. W242]MDT0554584.1 TlpA disulfide reductase family protein [Constantimarinum sp. W242]
MKNLLVLLLFIVLISCTSKVTPPKSGEWRAVLDLGNGKELPFLFTYNDDESLIIYNAEESIEVNDITLKKDSIIIEHPVFEGVFKGVFTETSIKGDFIKPSLDRVVPFIMEQGKVERFDVKTAPDKNVTGIWETVFSPGSEEDRYIAKGVFEQVGHKVTGTFRTTTGDYRYLDGAVENDSMKLSTFDGAHAFLFEAKVTDSTLNGIFYSGNHWKEPFTAKRNQAYELPSADSLTFLRKGYDKIEFSFPDTTGKLVSLSDDRFKNKVVLVQIMGTWCPNCLDESKYYKQYLEENLSEDLEIIALAFEYAKTEEKAVQSITKFKEGTGVQYPVLLAQFGTSDKKEANKKLPMLNHVLSYPTTIFIDKKGEVRKIHTGFNGPATGKKYEEFIEEFERFVSILLEE